MASYKKRGKTWQYTISRMVNGKYKPIRKSGFRTKGEAIAEASDIESKMKRGILGLLTPMPFEEYFEGWVKLYKTNISNTTMKHYDYTLKAIKEYFEGKAIQDIKRDDYQLFINEYGATRGKETVEKVNSHIRSCVKDAMEDGIVHIDFTRKVELTYTTPSKKPKDKHLNYRESELLINELFNRLDQGLGYYILLLGLTTGLRYGELVGLTRKDFDFKNNRLNIDKTWGYMERSPKGFGQTKNEESIRNIKVNDSVMKAFEKLFQSTPTNLQQLVFYSPSSKYKVISNTNANKLLKKVLEELKIGTITMHGLRHTHASVSLYKKVSINYISERLGHKDIETTWKTYAHILDEMREEDENETMAIFERMIV